MLDRLSFHGLLTGRHGVREYQRSDPRSLEGSRRSYPTEVVRRISTSDATARVTVGFNVGESEHVGKDVFLARYEDIQKTCRNSR